ncbi:hypothetical protein NC651_032156 [Populus alba x Populus x berolinensis]|nr:hypothetical protein NC651_032156 [Populus alba x Populus x berolinensis]
MAGGKKKEVKKEDWVRSLFQKGREFWGMVCVNGEMIEYYDISGCYILRPWAMSIWEIMQVAWVTKSGKSDLEIPIAIRPTSETVMYPYFSKWIRGHRDLPLKLNQWCNVVSLGVQQSYTIYQEPGVPLAGRAHCFCNKSKKQMKRARKVRWRSLLVDFTQTSVEAFIPNTGRGVQGATSHCLGQNFAKMFEINLKMRRGRREWPGRTLGPIIGVMVMVHGDDKGLILPPKVSSVQVIVVPVPFKDANTQGIFDACAATVDTLCEAGIRAEADYRDNYSPGWKYSHWEMKGVPLRIEIGPKDLANNQVRAVRRDNAAKVDISCDNLVEKFAKTWDEFKEALSQRKMILAPWCDEEEVEKDVKDRTRGEMGAAKSLCSPFDQPELPEGTTCFASGKPAKKWTYWGRNFYKKTNPCSSFFGEKSLNMLNYGAKTSRLVSNTRRKMCAVASLGGLLGGIFKGTDTGESTRKQYAPTVSLINQLEAEMSALSDSQLRDKTAALKERAQLGESLDSLLPEAFAVVREASKRVIGLRPFDVQLIGGMVLHKGEIAEMRTGEGKTLVAILPAYLNALSGKGVHIVTVNDYLARRDCEWVGQVPRFLGLKVGLIQQNMTSEQRRENYMCDITYVTNSELVQTVEELVLRDFNYCVIDEQGPLSLYLDQQKKPSDRYYKAAKIATAFERDIHYTVDEKQKTVLLTEQGYGDTEEILDVKDLYDPREQWASYILNAIKAKELFLRDVNYIIRGKEVLIVDEFTGRVMQGRRWSDGLHQAVEAKEGLPIQNETVTLASISYQNFFLQFPKLCGMTGTAATESTEFESIYKLKVTIVPTNKPMMRKDESDVVFRATSGKWRSVVVEISRMNKTGRPVLVGTTSVEQSDALAGQLLEAGIPHEVLNANRENVEREAEIVAQSGRVGAVTIATNHGRSWNRYNSRWKCRIYGQVEATVVRPAEGVFVSVKKSLPQKTWKVNESLFPCKLSNENTKLAEEAVQLAVGSWGQRSLTELEAEERLSYSCEKGPAQDEVIAKLRSAFLEIVKEFKEYTEEERKKVVSAGGLHVVGTERHESRRIDNQLRGRSGRQGDPGSSRFFLSLEDNLFRIFGGDRIQGLMRAFRVEDLPIESNMLTKSLDEAQRKVENYFFDIRKQLFEYDEVLNSQRDRVYSERRRALESDNLQSLIIEYAELTMDDILEANIGSDAPVGSWDLEKLIAKVQQYCYLLNDLTPDLLRSKCSSYEDLQDYLRLRGREAYLQKRDIVEKEAPGLMKEAERFLILSNIDRLWKEHLQAIKFVQQAVGLRGYAQRDPLIEYKLEGYNLFLEMMAQIRRNVIYSIYQFQPVMVKKDQEQSQNDKSTKVVRNGRGGKKKPDPVGTTEPSSAASPQASA